MKTFEIAEQRALKITEMRGLLANAGDALSPEQQGAFDRLKSEVIALEEQQARAEFLESAERRQMSGPDRQGRDLAGLEGRVSILRTLQAQLEGRSLTGAEAEFAAESERRTGRRAEGVFVPLAAFERRANTTSSAPELVPADHRADQYIEPLRAALLARRLGVRVLNGLRGNVTIPKHGSGLSVGWVAEGGAVGDSDMSFDPVTLSPKHAGGKTEMSRQLLMQNSPDIEALVRDDLAFAIARALDSALILGGGTAEPIGVLGTAGILSASLSTLSWTGVHGMIEKADLEHAPVSSWLTSPKVKTKLATTLKAAGVSGYLLENGRLADMPLHSTTQVPAKAGTPATGRVILGDWSQVLLGIWSEIDLLVNPFSEPAYSRGGVVVRAMATCDVAVRHPKAFVVADDVVI